MATKIVRMLSAQTLNGIEYQSNDVVEVDADLIGEAIRNGLADDDKEAVAYAQTLSTLKTHNLCDPVARNRPAPAPRSKKTIKE